MSLSKCILHFDKGACSMADQSSVSLKDVYVQSIDHIGVLINSHSEGDKGNSTFYPMRFVARVEMVDPLRRQQPSITVPRPGFRQ